MQSSMLLHSVCPWKKGNRTCCVFWTHEGLFNWVNKHWPDKMPKAESDSKPEAELGKKHDDSSLDDDHAQVDLAQLDLGRVNWETDA